MPQFKAFSALPAAVATPVVVAISIACVLTTLAPHAGFAQTKTVPPPSAGDPDDPGGNDLNLYTKTAVVAGKPVWIRVRSADADKARKALDGAIAEIGRVHRKFLQSSKTGEITSINHIADREEVRISTETEVLLSLALKFCRMSDSGFDPTMASFNYLWDFERRPFVPPLPDEIAARLAMTGCDKFALKPNRGVRVTVSGVRLGVSELLNGHALQRASNVISNNGIGSYVIRIGRDQYVMGRNKTRYWYTPISHPLDSTKVMLQVYVGSHGVATRSVRDRSVLHRGTWYHDVLDPKTGGPVTGVLQATVISPDPVLADALSRALLALGPERGLAMLAKVQQHVEGFVVDAKGVVHATPGMKSLAPKLPTAIGLKVSE